MAKAVRFLAPVLWGVLLASSLPAQNPASARAITWLIVDQPPQFILKGPDQGQGSQDLVLEYLKERLPQYRHSSAANNIQRNLGLLKDSDRYAALGLIRTPDREATTLLSQPYTLALPPGLLARKADLARLQPFRNSQGLLDLDALLKDGGLTLGVAAGRSYGPSIDEILARYSGADNLNARFAERGILAGLVDMLIGNRIDGVLAFRGEVRYVIRDEKRLEALTVVPLWPVAAPLTIHVMVPRTDWGREFLRALDPILIEARTRPEFRALTERWTDDATRAMLATALKTLDPVAQVQVQ